MHEELLTEIGLTKSEIAVYFALLEIGSSTTGPIIKKSSIASGKAYLILDKLILKGLVTHVIKSGFKHFQAKDPEQLLDYIHSKERVLHEKEERLRKVLPEIKRKFEQEKCKPLAEVYEGVKGLKSFYDWALKVMKKGDTIQVMGVPSEANEKFQTYFLNWNLRRIEQGIQMKIAYNSDCKEFGKKREKMKLTKVKYMKSAFETPAWIVIFQDYVVTINVHTSPVCFLIKNKESAQSYLQYFEQIWKQSK